MVECKDCNNLRKRNPGLCGALKKRVNIYDERECKYFTTEDVSELFQKEGEANE